MKNFDPWSIAVILITLVLFITALFVKGLSHDLLLEAGVFLVSVKLIMLGYTSSIKLQNIENELKALKCLLENRAPENSSLHSHS